MASIPVIPVELTDDIAQDKSLVIQLMAENIKAYLTDVTQFFQDVITHEQEMETDVLTDIALPHAKSGAVKTPFIAIGRYLKGVIWNNDNKVKLVIMIGAPQHANQEHLTIIAKLASNLANDEFAQDLLNCNTQLLADKIRGLYE